MWILQWLYQRAFCENPVLVVVFVATILVLVLGGWMALHLNRSGYALAFSLFVVGGNLIALFVLQIQMQNVVLYFATVLCACGISYICALSVLSFRAYMQAKKEEINAMQLSTCYTLPNRDNAFVRERLHTVLQQTEETGEDTQVSFSYVRRLLLGLRNTKLSLTESLETEELSKLFALYTKKETLTTEDVNVLNEAFSRVLKMSAKHNVTMR